MPKPSLANRVLSACGMLAFLAIVVVFDLGCPSDNSDSNAAVSSITLAPSPVALRVGGTVAVHATILSTKNKVLTGHQVDWTSNNPAVATVDGDTEDAYVTGVSAGTATIQAGSDGKSSSVTVTVSNVPVASVTVSGPTTVALNGTVQLTATPKDDAGNALTGRFVTWASSNPAIASVSTTGQVTGNLVGGPVTITATIELHDGTASMSVTATPIATITVSGLTTVPVGVSTAFTAVLKDAAGNVLPNAGRVLDWTSSNPNIASVSQAGSVTGVAVGGPITIRVDAEGKTGSAPITVTSPVSLTGRVINYTNGNAISGATVNFRRNDGGLGSLWGSVTSAADGSFTSPATSTDLSQGVIIEAVATGFVTGRVLVASTLVGGVTPAGDVPLVPTSAQPGGISGTIRNALTGNGMAGASVSAFDNIQIAAVQTTTSDGSGNYAFTNLQAGTYRLSASASGFTTSQRTGVAVGNGGTTANQDLVLSPSGSNTITIVLTWGASPNDLDSHLTGPTAIAGGRFHVYYASRGSKTISPFAFLDVDDVSSFGPETITITQMESSTAAYRYSVHDFTNRNSTTSSALGSSGAKATVYTATGVQTFFVPAQAGTLWTVFELTGTLTSPLIQARNQMSFVSDASAITAPPIDGGGLVSDAWLIARAAALHPKPRP